VRHLWPRSITQPPLTDADKQYLETAMSTEVRRPEQQISIDFTPNADGIPPAR
jgi:membrane protein